MIVSKRTFNVTIKDNKGTYVYAVLANNLVEAEQIVSEWMFEQNFVSPEITAVTQTGDIIVKEN